MCYRLGIDVRVFIINDTEVKSVDIISNLAPKQTRKGIWLQTPTVL